MKKELLDRSDIKPVVRISSLCKTACDTILNNVDIAHRMNIREEIQYNQLFLSNDIADTIRDNRVNVVTNNGFFWDMETRSFPVRESHAPSENRKNAFEENPVMGSQRSIM